MAEETTEDLTVEQVKQKILNGLAKKADKLAASSQAGSGEDWESIAHALQRLEAPFYVDCGRS